MSLPARGEFQLYILTETCLQVEDSKLSDGNSSTCLMKAPAPDNVLAETTIRVKDQAECFVEGKIALNITLGMIYYQ